jgi:hypothetical protein
MASRPVLAALQADQRRGNRNAQRGQFLVGAQGHRASDERDGHPIELRDELRTLARHQMMVERIAPGAVENQRVLASSTASTE